MAKVLFIIFALADVEKGEVVDALILGDYSMI